MKFNKTLVFTIILFIGYGILNFLPSGVMRIPVPIGEKYNYGLEWFNLDLKTLLDIIIAPPFLLIMFYFINKAITENKGPDYNPPSQKKKDFVKFVTYSAGVVLVAGIIMHAVANVLNGFLDNPVPPSGDLQIAIYWFDEVLGHKLIHFGVVAFLVVGMVKQFWHRRVSELSKLDAVGLYFWASGIGVVYLLAAAQGQAAFDLLVISIILIGIIVYYMIFKGLKLFENLFTHFVLIFCISMVITSVVYGWIEGIFPGYPFFHQTPGF